MADDNTPNGWNIGIVKSKGDADTPPRFRPTLKFGDTLRAVMPIGVWFDTEKEAQAEGDAILGIGLKEAYDKGHAAGHRTGYAEGVHNGNKEGYADGHDAGKLEASRNAETALDNERKKAASDAQIARAEGHKQGLDRGTTRGFIWGAVVVAILIVGGAALARHLGISL